MPRNGSGVYSLPQAPFTSGSVISSSAVNSDFSDIASALTASLPRDGQAGMTGQVKSSDGSTLAPGYSFTNETNTGFIRPAAGQIGIVIAGVQVATIDASGWEGPVTGSIPVGAMINYGGSSAPAKWVLCYGQALNRVTYALLFTAIGTNFGSGDGVTTFNMPDGRGRVYAGKDDMGGVAAGRLTTAFYGSDPTVLGNGGGTQSKQLALTNLPALVPAGTNAPSSVTVTANSLNIAAYGGGNPGLTGSASFGSNQITSITSSGTALAQAFTGTALAGANSTAFSVVTPSLIVNKIIYAGV